MYCFRENSYFPFSNKKIIAFFSGSFQIIIADTFNVDQATVSRVVHSVCNALVRRSHRFIKFPTAQGIEENKRKFYDIGNIPNIFGLIDGTHVRIIAPSQHEDQFVNRKGYHSINVQVVVNADSHSLFTKFPALIMFVISYHILVLSAEVIDEENVAFKTAFLSFKTAFLFSYSSNNTNFSLSVQFVFPLDIFFIFNSHDSNIQTHPTLNVYPNKAIVTTRP